MDSESRMLRNVVITLGACWVYVGCVWVACALTGASFPGVASLVRIVSLPAVTLVVSVVLCGRGGRGCPAAWLGVVARRIHSRTCIRSRP